MIKLKGDSYVSLYLYIESKKGQSPIIKPPEEKSMVSLTQTQLRLEADSEDSISRLEEFYSYICEGAKLHCYFNDKTFSHNIEVFPIQAVYYCRTIDTEKEINNLTLVLERRNYNDYHESEG